MDSRRMRLTSNFSIEAEENLNEEFKEESKAFQDDEDEFAPTSRRRRLSSRFSSDQDHDQRADGDDIIEAPVDER